jgi:hypothetical protein
LELGETGGGVRLVPVPSPLHPPRPGSPPRRPFPNRHSLPSIPPTLLHPVATIPEVEPLERHEAPQRPRKGSRPVVIKAVATAGWDDERGLGLAAHAPSGLAITIARDSLRVV